MMDGYSTSFKERKDKVGYRGLSLDFMTCLLEQTSGISAEIGETV